MSDVAEFIGKYLIIYPFLFVVGILDKLIGLVVPRKFEDSELPDKTAVLSRITNPDDPTSPYRSVLSSDLITIDDPDINLYKKFESVVSRYLDRETLGVREILSIDDEVQSNGKVFKKFSLGNYKWTTYEVIHMRIENLSNGLLQLGIKSDDNIVLFAETRPEWLLSAFACFRIKVPVVTLYATLGVDALAFGINQTNSSFIIVSGEQLPKLQKILHKIPNIAHIIVISDPHTEKNVDAIKKATDTVKVVTLAELEERGNQGEKIDSYKRPKKDDLAIIMYTSGSTGNPKGVMMSHGNVLVTLKTVIARLGSLDMSADIYVAYLPLAHILELCSELGCILNGIKVAYSSPQTIADTSTAIKRGQKGDLRVLKPTIMAAVPIVLERLSKVVYEKLSTTSWFKQTLFKLAYEQKLKYFRLDRSTRILDRILFKRISRAVLGGKIRLMLCGGAILNKEVHEFVQVCLSPVMQAYGLTETCAAAITQLPNQTDTETIGSVVPCCEIRLVDWPEAGYRCTDKPNPRGEIYVGGENVTMGYYNLPDKTSEDYKYINGIRYFATGDIGEVLPNGSFKIIDRKKDLVKLQGGEYVSLNKVESVIKLLAFVDNCCVIADPRHAHCVCLISPNVKKIVEYIEQIESEEQANTTSKRSRTTSESANEITAYLEKNPTLLTKLTKEMIDHCLKQGLDRFETPTKIEFVKEQWLPDSGLVTDSLKLKRREIDKFYSKNIAKLYS